MKTFFLFFAMALPLFAAVTISWQSPFDTSIVNQQSDGVTLLDETFKFAVGKFEGDPAFVPAMDNLADWEEKWVEFGVADYMIDAGGDSFGGSKSLVDNSVFKTTDKVYIWGWNGKGPGSEWILVSHADWKWPNANPGGPPPFPVFFQMGDAMDADAILGAVNSGGVVMKTAQANFNLTYDAWVDLNFEEGDGGQGMTDDPDDDGRSNFLEYAVGSDPKVKDTKAFVSISDDLKIEIQRAPNRAVNWELFASATLRNFQPVTTGFEIIADEPTRLVYGISDLTPPKRFFQIMASP